MPQVTPDVTIVLVDYLTRNRIRRKAVYLSFNPVGNRLGIRYVNAIYQSVRGRIDVLFHTPDI